MTSPPAPTEPMTSGPAPTEPMTSGSVAALVTPISSAIIGNDVPPTPCRASRRSAAALARDGAAVGATPLASPGAATFEWSRAALLVAPHSKRTVSDDVSRSSSGIVASTTSSASATPPANASQ
jgi:hypothetical protein